MPTVPRSRFNRRATVAALARHRSPDDPDLAAERRDLAADSLAEHVKRTVDQFPPLTPEQRDRIAALLRGPASLDETRVRRVTRPSTAGGGGEEA